MIFGHRWFYNSICGILLIAWTLFFTNSREAERTDPVLATARDLQAQGNNSGAVTEYLRYLFFHPTAENLSDVYLHLGKVYMKLNRWEQAKDAWRQAVKLAPDDSTQNALRVALAIQSLAHKNYSLAVLELLKVSSFARQPALRRKAQFYLGVANLYARDFKQAEEGFRLYFGSDSTEAAQQTWLAVRTLLQKGQAIRPKSPVVAKWLSTFLPGLGQLYAGDVKNALNAFALNGAIGFGVVRAFQDKEYIDATLEGGLLFQRYYLGNRFRAAQIARSRYLDRRKEIAAEIVHILESYLEQKKREAAY